MCIYMNTNASHVHSKTCDVSHKSLDIRNTLHYATVAWCRHIDYICIWHIYIWRINHIMYWKIGEPHPEWRLMVHGRALNISGFNLLPQTSGWHLRATEKPLQHWLHHGFFPESWQREYMQIYSILYIYISVHVYV